MKLRFKFTSVIVLISLALAAMPGLSMPSSVLAAACYQAQFVADVTVPDGSQYNPDTAFKKTWRLKNIGSCAWNKTDVSMIFDSGAQMGGPASVALPSDVAVGDTVDISVDLKSPSTAGHYIGYWKFKGAQGVIFGIGINANKAWWVEINVTGGTTSGVAYDFIEKAADAIWSTNAGTIKFPGTDGDSAGFAVKKDKPKLESGTEFTEAALLVAPRNITNGFIQAVYPAVTVQSGDRFHTVLGCEYNASTCYVTYRLDYEINGVSKTFWTFRERYEGLSYTASVDLSPLAGKKVNFVLVVGAYGSPVGDRALWGHPVILRSGTTATATSPAPTITGTPPTAAATNTLSPSTPTVPPSTCDKVQYVSDVNVPDGTIFQPGAQFTKTWRLKNVGSCKWTTSYQLVFFSGEKMGASSSAAFPKEVPVGSTVDISINMTAPSAAGSYRGYWMFKNADGALFGLGAQGNTPWWVDIKVSGPTVTPGGATVMPSTTVTPGGPTATPIANSVYEFAANTCNGTWFSAAGQLPCPGKEGDAKGFVLTLTNPKLETGVTDTRPTLLTFPQNVQNGYIQGFFPPFSVQSGDHFRSAISCENGATGCYVAFRLDYQTGADPIKTYWGPFLERYEGQVYNVDVDLTQLAGKDVKFILTVLAAGGATGDRALWIGPYIYRPSTSASTTPAPGNTPAATLSATAGATSFQNNKYKFKMDIPSGGSIASQADNESRVNLPISAGTNLIEKYAMVNVLELQAEQQCSSPVVNNNPISTENVTINTIGFGKQIGQGIATGNIYDWVVYLTSVKNVCISVTFILHSASSGISGTPLPAFDKNAESAAFTTMINSFNFIQ